MGKRKTNTNKGQEKGCWRKVEREWYNKYLSNDMKNIGASTYKESHELCHVIYRAKATGKYTVRQGLEDEQQVLYL